MAAPEAAHQKLLLELRYQLWGGFLWEKCEIQKV